MYTLVFIALLTIASVFPIGNGVLVKRSNDQPATHTPSSRAIDRTNGSITITPGMLSAIYPRPESCPTEGEFASECRTFKQAAPFVTSSFKKYNIATKPEAAAILSLMLFESAGFNFNIHHFPGPNPGQGTRNMMNFPFILEYALEVLPEDADVQDAVKNTTVNDDEKTKILGKVLGDDLSFATGAWFYQRKCDYQTKVGVRNGTEAGWRQYITKCVGTSAAPDRLAGWNKTMSEI